MAGATTKFGLRKPAGTDLVNVTTDLDNNFDTIDAALGNKKRFQKTTANYIVNGVAWVALDTPASDLVVKVAVGDWVEVGMSALWFSEAPYGYLDAQSIIAAAPVNAWGTVKTATDTGIPSWEGVGSAVISAGGGIIKQVLAGDIDVAGNLNLRLYVRTSVAAAKTLFASVDSPFTWWVKNLGQP